MRRNLPVAAYYYHQSNRRLNDHTIRSEIVGLAIVLATVATAAMCYLIWPPL
jgi:hypothetical protein